MNEKRWAALEQTIHKEHGNIAGLVVLKDGKVAFEQYYNAYTATDPVHIFSVTKSIISILFGIAICKGYIEGVEQRVLDFFPQYTVKRGEKTIQSITIRHLLTMTAPFKFRSAPYTNYFTSDDWVKAALDLLGGKKPVGTFRYLPLIGPDILSGILASATGRSVRGFAQHALFDPLSITVPTDIIFRSKDEQFAFLKAKSSGGWVADPKGVNTAGWGLALTAMDMAKIGQLMLGSGAWQGKQIVPETWVAESTREHSRWEGLDLPFGYLWWPGEAGTYAAMGDSGNMIYVNTNKSLVVSVAALFKPGAADRRALVEKHIEPMFDNT